jgi:hypothetical protein
MTPCSAKGTECDSWAGGGSRLGRRSSRARTATNGEVFRRGVDLIPRRQVQRGVLLKALTEEELRDIKSGKRVNAERHAILVRGAMLEDMAIAFRRVAYAGAHEKGRKLREAVLIAGAIVKLGDHIAVTTFVSSGAPPNQEIPPEQGRRQLSPSEDAYVEIREEDVP